MGNSLHHYNTIHIRSKWRNVWENYGQKRIEIRGSHIPIIVCNLHGVLHKDYEGSEKGTLPFRYLEVPISARNISAIDNDSMAQKITSRIRGWGTRNFFYAGRVQLINSVLMHVHTYWASIFILLKLVVKRITAIRRNFLWDGKVETNRTPLMAWDVVTRPKKEREMGIRDCVKWNEAAIKKYVWDIAKTCE
ncbi:PREDICTED: uncharacterized protein LOC109241151 [Nicotiana attenuata]|uniref:uncharacterized protein LOC109241151 n=1 Tax=Nicotiana attenuata TaxID=49451 RepID=UPI00090589AF|nr:PREDICTED: uncharacterized protein LOC109241151 [Nicotiana attenuata]